MIKLFTSILVLLCLSAHGQTKRVLFLGNSFTTVNDLPEIIYEVANSTGIFRKDPLEITYDFGLEASVAENIRTAVKRVMYDSLISWRIGEYDLVSDFSYSQLSGYTFQFTSLSQNASGQIWDFDGVINTTAIPTFTFPDSGTYSIKHTAFNQCDTLVSSQVIFVSEILTSLESIAMPDKPIIYPNPACEKVYLDLDATRGVSIYVYGIDGKNVLKMDNLIRSEIDIHMIKNGLYSVVVTKGNETFRQKLIIQK